MSEILIRKSRDPYGWMGNMSPYPVTDAGKSYRTTEALFQALRFEDQEVVEEIRTSKSPMSAKMIAKRHRDKMVVEPRSSKDLENMRHCLKLKLEQHPELFGMLLETGDRTIIEDCSNRATESGLFWGAAKRGDSWEGENHLGRLWMTLRHL